jgi:hypothetical protein
MDGTRFAACRTAGTSSIVAIMVFGWVAPAVQGQPTSAPPEPRVARLIRDLGAQDYAVRQQANAQLASLGSVTRAQLERALLDKDLEVRLRARRLLDQLELEELWQPAIVEYQAEGEPASKILAALADQSGNHIHIGDPYGNFSEKKLDADFAGISYWQAVDDICNRAGNRIRPHYDMHTPGIVVSAGTPPKYPRAYRGPVRGQITDARRTFIEELNYEQHEGELTNTFQIDLKFSWEDRFRIVGYATQPTLVEAVTDNHVVCSAAQPTGGGWNATTRGLRQVTAKLKLNPVPISAKAFDVFTIRWGLIAVGQPAVLEMKDLDTKQTYAQDDLAARIVSIDKSSSNYTMTLVVTRDLAMPEPREVVFQEYQLEIFDADGRKFRVHSQSPSLSDRGVQLKLKLAGESPDSKPVSLKLHYPRLRARRDLELTFRNVPLPTGRPE